MFGNEKYTILRTENLQNKLLLKKRRMFLLNSTTIVTTKKIGGWNIA